MKHIHLDSTDLKIIAQLQVDGALSNVELARRVHLSPSPCLLRVKALATAGVIQKYVALVDAAALGLGLNVFINISLKTQSKEALAEFERRIAEHDEVMECYLMTGDSDYLIRVAVADMAVTIRLLPRCASSARGCVSPSTRTVSHTFFSSRRIAVIFRGCNSRHTRRDRNP